MDLRTYWLAIKAGWLIVLGAVVIAVTAAALLSWPSPPQYASTTRLFVAATTGGSDLSELYQRNAVAALRVVSYVELARSTSVADDVSEALGVPVDSGAVTAAVVPQTVIMSVTVTATDPERARDVAAAYAEVLPTAIEDLEQLRDPDGPKVRAVVIDEANLPTSALATSLPRNLVAALLLGLGIGCGVAVLRFALKRTDTAPERTTGTA